MRHLTPALHRNAFILLATTIALLSDWTTSSCAAQSIWRYRSPQMVNLVGDTGARHVGDLITILIREATDVENRDQRRLGKSTDTSYNLDFSSTGDLGEGVGTLDINNQSDRNFDGRSQFSVEQEFTDRVTVRILDILPNGNFVIGGKRRRLVAGEIRTLLVSGTVRELDVSPNNTVSSQRVADFKICYEGDGPETSFSNQGWAGRFVNKIWPF